MQSKRFSIGLTAALAIFAMTLLVTGTAASQEQVLYSFNDNGTDGLNPVAGVISDGAGNLYGTTGYGGAYGFGAVFELTPGSGGTWTEIVLHSFNNKDGDNPYSGLIFDTSGNLYGTTVWGGAYGGGTVFELTPGSGGTWTETVLHSFKDSGKDGNSPYASLIFDASGDLYGTTSEGGTYVSGGTVFQLTPGTNGKWTEKVLHSFVDNGRDGLNPNAGLIFDTAGNLYGTTYNGGSAAGRGTVFRLTPGNKGKWTEKVLHSFNGKDGSYPAAGLIFDTAGNLYSTTSAGGASGKTCSYGCGTVFELTPGANGAWMEMVLHKFKDNGKDGLNPYSGLIFDAFGTLYGTTQSGGVVGGGTVFELVPSTNGKWTKKVLFSFDGGEDGGTPYSGLIFDTIGNLYGTTSGGGAYGNYGTVFEVAP